MVDPSINIHQAPFMNHFLGYLTEVRMVLLPILHRWHCSEAAIIGVARAAMLASNLNA